MNFIYIYYVPIGTETYIPVTTANVEELATQKSRLIFERKEVRELLRVIENAEQGEFDPEYVRVKLILPKGEIIYIDNTGGASVDSEQKFLDGRSLATVKELIESLLR